MEVGLARQARLAAGDRGAQARQAGGVGGGRPGPVGDRPAPRRGGQASHIDEVLDRDPQPGTRRGFLQDPRGHKRSVWQGTDALTGSVPPARRGRHRGDGRPSPAGHPASHPFIVNRREPRRDPARDRRQRGDSEVSGRESPRRPVISISRNGQTWQRPLAARLARDRDGRPVIPLCFVAGLLGEYAQNAALLHLCPQAGTFRRDRHQ